MQRPKLKDNQGKKLFELYPLGNIPHDYIIEIGKWIAYRYAFGKTDIDGEDWGDIFAKAIGGQHLSKPLGLADVEYEGMAWSVKSVKNSNPHKCKSIRVISGRCSPDYSYNISNPHEDVNQTGRAVLNIWNERVNIAKDVYEPLRISILVRNPDKLEYLVYEEDAARYNTNNYIWKSNKNGNIEGYEIATEKHKFTWQPHGSQFTVLYDIPPSAIKFKVKRPPVFDFEQTLNQMGFDSSWIEILE